MTCSACKKKDLKNVDNLLKDIRLILFKSQLHIRYYLQMVSGYCIGFFYPIFLCILRHCQYTFIGEPQALLFIEKVWFPVSVLPPKFAVCPQNLTDMSV